MVQATNQHLTLAGLSSKLWLNPQLIEAALANFRNASVVLVVGCGLSLSPSGSAMAQFGYGLVSPGQPNSIDTTKNNPTNVAGPQSPLPPAYGQAGTPILPPGVGTGAANQQAFAPGQASTFMPSNMQPRQAIGPNANRTAGPRTNSNAPQWNRSGGQVNANQAPGFPVQGQQPGFVPQRQMPQAMPQDVPLDLYPVANNPPQSGIATSVNQFVTAPQNFPQQVYNTVPSAAQIGMPPFASNNGVPFQNDVPPIVSNGPAWNGQPSNANVPNQFVMQSNVSAKPEVRSEPWSADVVAKPQAPLAPPSNDNAWASRSNMNTNTAPAVQGAGDPRSTVATSNLSNTPSNAPSTRENAWPDQTYQTPLQTPPSLSNFAARPIDPSTSNGMDQGAGVQASRPVNPPTSEDLTRRILAANPAWPAPPGTNPSNLPFTTPASQQNNSTNTYGPPASSPMPANGQGFVATQSPAAQGSFAAPPPTASPFQTASNNVSVPDSSTQLASSSSNVGPAYGGSSGASAQAQTVSNGASSAANNASSGAEQKQPEQLEEKVFEGGKLIAVVGEEPILLGDVLPLVEAKIAEFEGKIPPRQKEVLRQQLVRRALQDQVVTKCLAQRFIRDTVGVKPEKDYIEFRKTIIPRTTKAFYTQYIPTLMEKQKVETEQELDAKLREMGTSIAAQLASFGDSVLADDVIKTNVPKSPKVDLEEIRDYYESHIEEYQKPARAKWRELSVLFANHPSKEAAAKKISEMGNEILFGGTSFEAVAKKHSEGLTANKGGVFDWTTQGALKSKQVDESLFSIPTNRLSRIIEDEAGFHIIEVMEREDARTESFADTQLAIRKLLQEKKQDKLRQEFVEKVRKETPIWSLWPQDIPDSRPLSELYSDTPKSE